MNEEQFTKAIADKLNPLRLSIIDSRVVAKAILSTFLESEEINFGDPEYYWDQDTALELASEEMSHWES